MTLFSHTVKADRKGSLCTKAGGILMGLRDHAEFLQGLLENLVQVSIHMQHQTGGTDCSFLSRAGRVRPQVTEESLPK